MTDQELIAVLDARFAAVDSRFATLDSRFATLDSQFATLDSQFATLDSRFAAIDSRFAALDAQLETRFRHTDVQIESLRDETKRVAESVILVDEKLERFRAETTAAFNDQETFNKMLIRRIEAL